MAVGCTLSYTNREEVKNMLSIIQILLALVITQNSNLSIVFVKVSYCYDIINIGLYTLFQIYTYT